jgi:monofunctional glycosyltransferase
MAVGPPDSPVKEQVVDPPIMPPSAKRAAAKKRSAPKRTILSRLWRWLGMIALTLTAISAFFVLVYRFVPVPVTWLMVERAIAGDGLRRDWVPLDDISPNLIRAVIAAEDAKFCSHHGFDWQAIEDAMEANEEGRSTRGGSTISQQTAKNVFLWPARSWVRKGFEAGFTVAIETVWPKRRIMEVYLNVAEFGIGTYGIEAAAQRYLGRDAQSMTPRQAAGIAAVLPSPRKWDPNNPTRRVARRIARIERGARVVKVQGLDQCVVGQ